MLLFMWILYIAAYVLGALAFYKLAMKAGRTSIAWFAWVPILNMILLLRLIDRSGWWLLMYLVPVASLVFAIIWYVNLLRAFGKNGAHVLFAIFLPIVALIQWIVWGFSEKTQYVGINRGPTQSPAFDG